jgi:hypothetical protein
MLNEPELNTLLSMLAAMVETKDLSDLALLQLLTPEQKSQLWAVVPIALRQDIHGLKSAST